SQDHRRAADPGRLRRSGGEVRQLSAQLRGARRIGGLIRVLAAFAGLTDLAEGLRWLGPSLADDWDRVWSVFEVWADQPGLSARLRAALRSLPPEQAAAVAARSRETTTHFAWCLVDSPDDPFSFWINEYKPHRDWLPGYADSIHNHRYHFCTTILSGGYLHEDFRVVLDPTGSRVTSVTPAARQLRIAGSAGHLQADE